MRRVYQVTITGMVIIDDGQPDGPGLSTPDNWAVHEIVTEMQGTDVDVQEMQVMQKANAMKLELPSAIAIHIDDLDRDTCHALAKALDLSESDLWNLVTKKQGPAEIEIKTSPSVSQPNWEQVNLYNAALADEAGES